MNTLVPPSFMTAETELEERLAWDLIVLHSDLRAVKEAGPSWEFLTSDMIKEDAARAFSTANKVLEERTKMPAEFKVIITDCDGVINGHDPKVWRECQVLAPGLVEGGIRAHPVLVGRLKAIVDATDAKIVISGPWQERHMDHLVAFFEDHGIPESTIIGRTGPKCTFREAEIKKWLRNHNEVTSFVILDDSAIWSLRDPRFIKTDYHVGLTVNDVVKAINILEGLGAPEEGAL